MIRKTLRPIFVAALLVWPASARTAPRAPSPAAIRLYTQNLKTVLGGIRNRSESLGSIRKAGNIARRIQPNDPTASYALGLALHSRQQFDAAAAQYHAAVKIDPTYLRAWNALFHLRLDRKDAKSLQSDAQGFAKVIADSKTSWRDKIASQDAAVLLGRVFGFLQLPDVEVMDKPSRDKLQTDIEHQLGSESAAAFKQGIASIAKDHKKFQAEVARQLAGQRKKSSERAQGKLGEIKERRQDIKKKAENLKLSADEWKSWIDKQLKEADTQLALCQKDYQVLDTAARRVNQLITQTQVEIGRLQTQYQLQGIPRRLAIGQPAVLQRQQEILRYQRQFNTLQQRAAQVVARARTVVAARAAAVKRYQDATGKIVKQDAMLTRWNQALKNSALKVKGNAGKVRSPQSLTQKLTSPGSYFELDFEAEADRLLKMVG